MDRDCAPLRTSCCIGLPTIVDSGTIRCRSVSNDGSARRPSLPTHATLFSLVPAVRRLSFLLALPLALSSVRAQQPEQKPDTITGRRSMHAVPVPSAVASPRIGNIILDGRLDEETWSKATP